MQIPLESMTVNRSISDDKKSILVDVHFTVKLPPEIASNLARILATNVLEIQDAEWNSVKMEKG